MEGHLSCTCFRHHSAFLCGSVLGSHTAGIFSGRDETLIDYDVGFDDDGNVTALAIRGWFLCGADLDLASSDMDVVTMGIDQVVCLLLIRNACPFWLCPASCTSLIISTLPDVPAWLDIRCKAAVFTPQSGCTVFSLPKFVRRAASQSHF